MSLLQVNPYNPKVRMSNEYVHPWNQMNIYNNKWTFKGLQECPRAIARGCEIDFFAPS